MIELLIETRARERGVMFDVGHGQGSFDWNVAEGVCCAGDSKFWPDTISTDLHTGNLNGSVIYGLSCCIIW